MTKNKDLNFLAEAYKNITAVPTITENTVDPNSLQNAIAHAVLFLSPPLLYKVYSYIKSLKNEQQTEVLPGIKLDATGNPVEPNETNTTISSSLRRDQTNLNKGKTKI